MNIKKMMVAVLLTIAMTLPQAAWATSENDGQAMPVLEAIAEPTAVPTEDITPVPTVLPEVTVELSETPIGEGTVVPEITAVPEVSREKATKKGWVTEKNGKIRYYLSNTSYVKSSWKKISGEWYYFDKSGYIVVGWQTIGGVQYYLKKAGKAGTQGRMLVGWNDIGKHTYYFEKSGALVKGWQKLGGQWYYFKKSGKAGALGRMLTGWQKLGGKVYYLKKAGKLKVKGTMLSGWQGINSKIYYFNSGGALQNGWQKLNNKWYYFKKAGNYGSLGKMLTGWQKLGGEYYYLKENGAIKVKGQMLTGWRTIDGKKYYLDKVSGKRLTGWHKIDGKDYYFGNNGVYDANKKKPKRIIAIDAGHQKRGDSTHEPIGPGASQTKPKVSSGTYGKWSKLNEYELNLIVAKKLQKELEKRGYGVYMIRTTHDVNISNSQRAKNAANAGAGVLVRIHANGDSNSSVYGALTMAPATNNSFLTQTNIANSRRLSTDIINSFCAATGAKNRGVQSHNDMSGINWSTIPVTIVEMGFMSNKSDDLNMAKSAYQDKMVKGMANGIDKYYK